MSSTAGESKSSNTGTSTGGASNSHSNNKKGKNNNQKRNSNSIKSKFKGKCEDLQGHVFDAVKLNQADEYIKVKNEIAEYVGTHYENGGDVHEAIESMDATPKFPKPKKPVGELKDKNDESKGRHDVDEIDDLIWKKEIEHYVKRKVSLNNNLRKAFSLVWGQCSDVMRDKIEAKQEWKAVKAEFDVIMLLELIRGINFKFDDQKYAFGSVYHANKRFYNYRQSGEDTNNEHYEKMKNLVKVVESYGGKLGAEDILLDEDPDVGQTY